MDTVEVTKMIDGVYKNILDNFNPSSRQMIASGKAYLKSLHGASAACSMYLDSLVKLSRQAQQSSFGCSSDVGSSLMQVSEVFKEIHTQQLNTLKAFYVDFLAPLEANLEKDTRVIQNEQKKFLMCHKQKIENYTKAAATVKKMRKKTKKSNSSTTFDKEIKVMQNLEDERSKLETFCEKSMTEALTQERRRYGFILERKASLAKHYMAFYYKGSTLLQPKLDLWNKVAKSREILPEPMQNALLKRIQGGGNGEDECIYCNPSLAKAHAHGKIGPKLGPASADDSAAIAIQLRKTKSMDASEIINVTCPQDLPLSSMSHHHGLDNGVHGGGGGGGDGRGTLCRAKSDLNLGSNCNNNAMMMNMSMNACCNGHGAIEMMPESSYILDSNTHTPTSPSPPNFHESTGTIMRQHHQQQQHGNGNGNGSGTMTRPKSLALGSEMTMTMTGTGSSNNSNNSNNFGFVKARYAYLSSGENQLCFLEGDTIALIGDRNNGWQYGENLRTQKTGWFPMAYTELDSANNGSLATCSNASSNEEGFCSMSPIPPPMPPAPPTGSGSNMHHNNSSFQQKRMNLADVMVQQQQQQHHRNSDLTGILKTSTPGASGPIKSLPNTPGCCGGNLKSPCPLPNGSASAMMSGHCTSANTCSSSTQTTSNNVMILPQSASTSAMATTPTTGTSAGGRSASDSLHSSNDSGFSNDLNNQAAAAAAAAAQQQLLLHMLPPPQPDIDYSDDEPHLSNSEEFKSGDKWLMDKYHKSESIRLGEVLQTHHHHHHQQQQHHVNNESTSPTASANVSKNLNSTAVRPPHHHTGPRRSLSFGNVSGWDNGAAAADLRDIDQTQEAEEHVVRDRNSRHQYHHNEHYHPTMTMNSAKDGNGALKKFLNRTKSFIWKRNGGGRDEPEFDSVSAVGSVMEQDIWGSHASLVDINYNNKGANIDLKELLAMSEEDKMDSNKKNQAPTPPRRDALPTPPPPPPSQPAPKNPKQGHNVQHQQKRSNSDVTQFKKIKTPDIPLNNKINAGSKSKGSRRIPLARVESYSGSESPIIPTTKNTESYHNSSSSSPKYRSAGGGSGTGTGSVARKSVGSGRRHGHGHVPNNSSRPTSVSMSMSKKSNPKYDKNEVEDLDYNNVQNFDDEDEEGVDTNVEDYDDNASSVFTNAKQPEAQVGPGRNSGSKRNSHYLVKSNSFRRNKPRHHSTAANSGHGSPRSTGKKSQSMRISHSTFASTTTTAPKNSNSSSDTRFRLISKSKNGENPGSGSMDIATLNNTIANTLHKESRRVKGSIHSEFHTVELIATDDDYEDEQVVAEERNQAKGLGAKKKVNNEQIFDYGSQIHRRLYYPERSSKLDQKSERSGNLCGPWYDLWGCDSSVTFA